MKKQNMNLPALVICAFLLQSILAEDDDGYPKLSNETVTQTVTKTVETTVEATQPPLLMGQSPAPPHLDYPKGDMSLNRVKWSGSLPERAVKVDINGTGEENFICAPRTGCNMTTGFYSPSKGPFCFHTCDGREDKSSEFDILVNELKSIPAEDDDGYPKLSIETDTPKVNKLSILDFSFISLPSLEDRRPFQAERGPHGKHQICRPQYKDSFLKWVEWSGSLPEWAERIIYHDSTLVDYICAPRTGCWQNTGFYNPSKGPFCFYPCKGKGEKASEFDILVNEQNLDWVEWKAYRVDIQNGVSSFDGICKEGTVDAFPYKVYVGYSKYGIGSVFRNPKDSFNFHLSLNGERYTEDIRVLTVQTGQSKVRIHNIEYHIDDLAMLSQQPNVLRQMKVENHNCRDIEQEVNLEGSTERQSSWETSISNSLTLSASIEVTVPFVSVSAGVEYSNSKTLTNGNSLTETISHSLSVKVIVPPNHSCVVKMAGKTNKFDIPYKAQLSREFTDGRVRTIPVSGTYKGVQVGEMHAVAERCLPLPNAKACPN